MERGTHGSRVEGTTGAWPAWRWASLAAALIAALIALPAGAIREEASRREAGSRSRFKSKSQSDQGLLSAGKVEVVVVGSPRARKLGPGVRGFGGGPALTEPAARHGQGGEERDVLASPQRRRQGGPAGLRRGRPPVDGEGPRASVEQKKGKKKGKSPKGSATADANRCPSATRWHARIGARSIASPRTDCLFPYPNDHYTVARLRATGTGLRVNLSAASTPANKNGVHIDPAAINTSDGFSPGATIVTRVPGLDNPRPSRRPAPCRSPPWIRPTTPTSRSC